MERCTTAESEADVGAKVLDETRARHCVEQLNVEKPEEVGFTRTEAMRILVSLLLVGQLGGARAAGDTRGVCLSLGAASDPAKQFGYTEVLLAFVLGVFVALGFVALWRREHKQLKNTMVQGPVTYLRSRAEPRYHALAEHSWGAW